MRRRVPVSLPLTAIRTAEPRQRDGQALAERVRACQEAEVRLIRTCEPDKRLYSLLDALSALRLASETKLAPDAVSAPARGNLTLF